MTSPHWGQARKVLKPVGTHPIADQWNNDGTKTSLRSDIITELGREETDWDAIDILRIGYPEVDDFPVVMFISVPRYLLAHGILDVHVEVKDSRLVRVVADAPRVPKLIQEPLELPNNEYERNLSDQIGVGIAAKEHLPEKERNVYDTINRLKRKVNMDPEIQKERFENYEHNGSYVKRLLDQYQQRSSTESRRFGFVAQSPAVMAKQSVEYNFIADWALIALNPGMHEKETHQLQNRLYVGNIDIRGQFSILQRRIDFLEPAPDGTIVLNGLVPVSEIFQPRFYDAKDGSAKLIVGKRGLTTGLTWGISNNVKSVIRQVVVVGQGTGEERSERLYSEWCVVSANGPLKSAFTAVGGSGACVWDLTGRIAGMVTSGLSGDGYIMDVTYVTPMSWLMSEMEEHGLDVVIP
ncbi:hypothetical protein CORC01_12175 [Colletotrichum orchidophilum]|uniref:Uncharacterized protein n=1 Tax=Colletotrichum orchidophilum TaxID=1209926 RepID=A0A1G4ATV0_9PEZI|nr:uncharacterized protein CORC01_12175 [Colletotrichum orchidophilum]OHE92526.1 hypothetical protein CORC01_12175 [Colletotrichum orchidophilum]